VTVAAALARLMDLATPPTCGGCGLPGPGVCSACRTDLEAPPGPGCGRCGHPWAIPTTSCAACPPGLDALRFAVAYRAPAPALIGALKDGRRRGLAEDLAALIVDRVGAPEEGTLVPVPLGPSRRAERGFNQAEQIARGLGRRWGMPVADLLSPRGPEARQRGARVEARRRNVRGAFVARDRVTVPRVAWVVDDVCTTGATLSACAAALRRAGAHVVGAVCLARVLGSGGE
jgi:ComF family protein